MQAGVVAPQLEGQLGFREDQRLALEIVYAGARLEALEVPPPELHRPVELDDAGQDREAGEMAAEVLERRRHADAVSRARAARARRLDLRQQHHDGPAKRRSSSCETILPRSLSGSSFTKRKRLGSSVASKNGARCLRSDSPAARAPRRSSAAAPVALGTTTTPSRRGAGKGTAAAAATHSCACRRCSSSGSESRLPSIFTTRSSRPRRRKRPLPSSLAPWSMRQLRSLRYGESSSSAPSASLVTAMPGKVCQTSSSEPPSRRRQATPPVSVLPNTSIGAAPNAARYSAAVGAESGPPEEKMISGRCHSPSASRPGKRASCAGGETSTCRPRWRAAARSSTASPLVDSSAGRPAASGQSRRKSRP